MLTFQKQRSSVLYFLAKITLVMLILLDLIAKCSSNENGTTIDIPSTISTNSINNSHINNIISNNGCPEDSFMDTNGECKCYPCPRNECQNGQMPVTMKAVNERKPGNCCDLYECRDKVSHVLKEETSNNETTMQCMDGRGSLRANGDEWQDISDPCLQCTCDNGKARCITAQCKSCTKLVTRLSNECCPRCDDDITTVCPVFKDCTLKCDYYEVDENHCKICKCLKMDSTNQDNNNNQNNSSTSKNEEKIKCPELECEVESLFCENGRVLEPNGCPTCHCKLPHCPSRLNCPTKKCQFGFKINKKGCLSCHCRRGCLDLTSNTTYPEGKSWSSEPCRKCTCEIGGQISCNETRCSIACDNPLPPTSGTCCPLCPTLTDEKSMITKGWGIIPTTIIISLIVICCLLMTHLIRNRFRARLAPSRNDLIAGYPSHNQQYYKCVPVYESHLPVLRHAEKIVPL